MSTLNRRRFSFEHEQLNALNNELSMLELQLETTDADTKERQLLDRRIVELRQAIQLQMQTLEDLEFEKLENEVMNESSSTTLVDYSQNEEKAAPQKSPKSLLLNEANIKSFPYMDDSTSVSNHSKLVGPETLAYKSELRSEKSQQSIPSIMIQSVHTLNSNNATASSGGYAITAAPAAENDLGTYEETLHYPLNNSNINNNNNEKVDSSVVLITSPEIMQQTVANSHRADEPTPQLIRRGSARRRSNKSSRTNNSSAGNSSKIAGEVARPLTRFLPCPNNATLNLVNHLISECGHNLASPQVVQCFEANAHFCQGVLYIRQTSPHHHNQRRRNKQKLFGGASKNVDNFSALAIEGASTWKPHVFRFDRLTKTLENVGSVKALSGKTRIIGDAKYEVDNEDEENNTTSGFGGCVGGTMSYLRRRRLNSKATLCSHQLPIEFPVYFHEIVNVFAEFSTVSSVNNNHSHDSQNRASTPTPSSRNAAWPKPTFDVHHHSKQPGNIVCIQVERLPNWKQLNPNTFSNGGVANSFAPKHDELESVCLRVCAPNAELQRIWIDAIFTGAQGYLRNMEQFRL